MSGPVDKSDSQQSKDEVSATASFTGSALGPGGQIGPHKLLSILGEGGFAVVYLAEQQKPVKRRVALKIIKPGMDSKQVIARFEAERQALALLDHPNVAHVYDAGTTELGRPYFVMEYVKGVPITEHCDRHKLTIEERLKLFLQVCEAVQHAHQKGIIHRDIKPSNILILFEGQRALPKVIDFGIAKAISQPLTERTLYTEQGQLVGTPEYMSPEQAEMTSQDIDTRSDIYSLGVLLYELMTGVLPFEAEELRKGGLDHIRTVIREQEPRTPSTRLSRLTHEESTKLAQHRRAEPAALRRRIRGDLDWITLKAMEKDRTRRYGSAGELAADIQRHLNHEPVVAGPPSTLYRVRKFVRRNRTLVAGIAAVLVVLVAGIVVSTLFAIGQARARAEADHARAAAQVVAKFLRDDVLRSAGNIKGRDATVIDVLNAAVAKLDKGEFKDQPRIEGSIRSTLGQTYYDLGYYAVAAQHQKRAHGIYAEQLGESHITTNLALNWLAVFYYHAGKYREAEPLYKQVIEKARQHKAGSFIDVLPMWTANLATTYAGQGRYEEAEQLLRKSLEDVNNWAPQRGWATQRAWAQYGLHLGEIYREQGKYEAAGRALLETLDACRQGQEEESDPIYYDCMVRCMNELALLHLAQEHYAEAEELFQQGIDIGGRELPGKDHPHTLRHINGLGVLCSKQERYEEAGKLFEQALAGRKLKLGEDHPETLETKNDLGVLYKEQGKYQEAEPLLLEAVKGRILKLGDKHPHTQKSLKNLIDLYEGWGKPEEAEKWRTKLLHKDNTKEQ